MALPCHHHRSVLPALSLLTKLFYQNTKNPAFKSYTVSGPLAFATAFAFAVTLYLASPMYRADDVEAFVRSNEAKLKQAVEDSTRAEKTNQILTDLNLRLIKGGNNSYHFELYAFLSYGYRILYTEHLQTKAPQSPGKSPTFRWHSIKENWYYYSYLD